MKKIITFCILSILSTFLFTSCKSNMSLTKRLYNDGYHVSYNNGKTTAKTFAQDHKYTPPKAEVAEYKVQPELKELNNTTPLAIAAQTEIPTSAPVNENMALNKKDVNPFTEVVKNKAMTVKSAFTKQNTCTVDKSNTFTAPSDEYSLIWVLVLVLLILWALGYLAGGLGLGGLINILLVIALILLILWLLRIV